MTIELVEITPDYCVETEGKYLVRTVGLFNEQFLQARVYRHFDAKKGRHVMKIDVNNQKPTHISTQPLPLDI